MQLVSAIVTTHNRAILAERAVESIKQQRYPEIEIIVVDDASTDDTRSRFESDSSLNYIYISPEESRGANYARNKGIEHSHGSYLAFLDDDDCWFPDKIEKQVKLIEEKGCGLVYCGRKTELIESGKTSYYYFMPQPDYQGDMSKRVLYTTCCLTSMILVSRQLLYQMGLWDVHLAFWQDHDFLIRAAQLTPFYYVNEPLCLYRKDLTDKQRRSNIFRHWKKNARYIHRKFRPLYRSLSFNERQEVRHLYWYDALVRSRAKGLKWSTFYYRFLLHFFYAIPAKVSQVFSL